MKSLLKVKLAGKLSMNSLNADFSLETCCKTGLIFNYSNILGLAAASRFTFRTAPASAPGISIAPCSLLAWCLQRGPSAARVPCCRPGCAHEALLHEASNHLCGSWQWKNGLHLSPCSQRLNLEDIKSSRYGQLFKLSVLSICIHPTVCAKSSSGRCSSSKRVDEREVCFLAHPP